MKDIFLKHERSEAAVATLEGQLIDSTYINFLVDDQDTTVYTPGGQILAIYLKAVLPVDLVRSAGPTLTKAARSPIVGGFRGTAAGTGTVRRIKKDGSLSKMRSVPPVDRLKEAMDGVLGYFDGSNLAPCRLTAYTGRHWDEFSTTVIPYAQQVDSIFRSYLPDRWGAQTAAAAASPGYVIQGTSFSTITCNKNFRTACHRDSGDFKDGFGVITCFRSGEFTGGTLVFPKFNLGIDVGNRDVLLCNVHELHGNTALTGAGTFKRVSCVFYFRERLKNCPVINNDRSLQTSQTIADKEEAHGISFLPYSQQLEVIAALEKQENRD
jgi:hypothetical protein